MTTVGLLGDGPAIEAVRAALADAEAEPAAAEPSVVPETDVAVAVVAVDDGPIDAVDVARRSATPLVVVEVGGVGGVAVAGVTAAASGAAPGTACHDCLRTRVAAADPDVGDAACPAPDARLAGALAGRELATLLEGGDSTLLGGVIEVPHAERRVLPVPNCACAGTAGTAPPGTTTPGTATPGTTGIGPPGAADREAPAGGTGGDEMGAVPRGKSDRSLDETIAAAEVAFDARVGPITSVGEAESFPAPYYLATLAATPFSDADAPEHAAGVAAQWDPAFMKALGEALERYGAAVYRTSAFVEEPADPVDPASIVGPGDAPDFDDVDAWYPGEHLGTRERADLPAELVVFPPPTSVIRPAITTGLGLGSGGVEALLSGLTEVIERDAAMLSWYSTYEPLGLAVDDDGFRTLAARGRSEDLETTALLLTQDVDVPVVAACVHRDGEWPRFAAGTAANLDPATAARGALEEAIQNWQELRRMGPERADEESTAIGAYASFPEPARSLVDPSQTVRTGDLAPTSVPTGEDALEALLERVETAGLEPYAASLTPRDVDDLGFAVVRVVVPGAQPLFTGEAYFGERARTVPASMGFEHRPDRPFHLFP